MDNQAKKEELFEIYLPLIQSEYLFSKTRPGPTSKEKIDSWRQEFMKKDLYTSFWETKTKLVSKLIELDMVRHKMYSGNAEFTEDEINQYFNKLMKRKIVDLVNQKERISHQIDQNYNYNSGEEGDR